MTDVNITIEINDNVSVTVKIPAVCDALTWQGVIDQTKALMRTAPLDPTSKVKRRVDYGDGRQPYSDEENAVFDKHYTSTGSMAAISRAIGKELPNRNYGAIYARVNEKRNKEFNQKWKNKQTK